jgi:hypothetical protein
MEEADRATRAAAQYAASSQEGESVYFFPSLDGAEMRSRWDMQDNPPDILITNFSMLSVMMMRETDESIFERTRVWLACEDLPEPEREEAKRARVFHLIVDELHLYRGTSGAEVAYLVQLLLLRLGLHPNHPQLRILASSASLEAANPKSYDFLKGFFGINEMEIIEGAQESVPDLPAIVTSPPLEPFMHLTSSAPNFTEAVLAQSARLGGVSTASSIADFFQFIESLELKTKMLKACEVNGRSRAVSVSYFSRKVFGESHSSADLLQAARGLLIARGLYDKFKRRSQLPSFRLHYFFRNIEGLWASVRQIRGSEDRPVGELYSSPRIISDAAFRVLEMLYCVIFSELHCIL